MLRREKSRFRWKYRGWLNMGRRRCWFRSHSWKHFLIYRLDLLYWKTFWNRFELKNKRYDFFFQVWNWEVWFTCAKRTTVFCGSPAESTNEWINSSRRRSTSTWVFHPRFSFSLTCIHTWKTFASHSEPQPHALKVCDDVVGGRHFLLAIRGSRTNVYISPIGLKPKY